ncbi:MAG TPA: DUF1015 domain-containing protein [Gaiellaceae bacterium]|nr:DUF1015 domain-containing protein [Gaiellaceae bacterium]
MAQVRPFRAVRYDERAGPLASLVAPPYDVLDEAARERYRASSPHNVVHLTLADDPSETAALWSAWLAEGVLALEQEAACWWLAQEYTGPDGVARTRGALVCSLRAEPYENRVVLPHERTHAGPKEGRLRLLRALRTHVEPIFLLFDGALERPDGESVLEVGLEGVRSRLWRLTGDPPDLGDARLLIADGHHRYETTLAYHAEEGTEESAWLLAAIVPTAQEGLTIFPTHRVAERLGPVDGEQPVGTEELPTDRSAAIIYRAGGTTVVTGLPGEPDTALVDRLGLEGVTYTPSDHEAKAAVESGAAQAAVLVRPPSVELVRELAERGETMPQKSTYFYPKLPSGLLFHPL